MSNPISAAIKRWIVPNCPHCDKPLGAFGDSFGKKTCPHCGGSVGRIQCPVCHATDAISNDHDFCRKCGTRFPPVGPVHGMLKILRRGPGVLAYKNSVLINDFAPPVGATARPERVHAEFIVEDGNQAVFFKDGISRKILDPGRYNLDSVVGTDTRLESWAVLVIDGSRFMIPSPITPIIRGEGLPDEVSQILLPEPVTQKVIWKGKSEDLRTSRAFSFAGIPDSENTPVTLNAALALRVGDVDAFYATIFRKNENIEQVYYDDIAMSSFAAVEQAVRDLVRPVTYSQMKEASVRGQIEARMMTVLAPYFGVSGMELVGVTLFNIANRDYDELATAEGQQRVAKLRGQFETKVLLDEVEIRSANIEARKKIMDQVVRGELSLEQAEKQLSVEHATILDRLDREGRLKIKQNELSAQDAMERSLLDLRKAQLMREGELTAVVETGEDHALARQQFLARLDLANQNELALLKIANDGAQALASGDQDILLVQQNIRRQQAMTEVLRVNNLQKIEAARTEADVKKIQADTAAGEARLWLDVKRQRATLELDVKQRETEIQLQVVNAERRHELERMLTESGIRKAELEALGGLSDVQAVAVLAQNRPELVNALAEKYKAEAGVAANAEIAALVQAHEAERKAILEQVMANSSSMARDAFAAAAGIAQAHKADIIVPDGTQRLSVNQTIRHGAADPLPPAPAAATPGHQVVACPSCGKPVIAGQPICGYCKADLTGPAK